MPKYVVFILTFLIIFERNNSRHTSFNFPSPKSHGVPVDHIFPDSNLLFPPCCTPDADSLMLSNFDKLHPCYT